MCIRKLNQIETAHGVYNVVHFQDLTVNLRMLTVVSLSQLLHLTLKVSVHCLFRMLKKESERRQQLIVIIVRRKFFKNTIQKAICVKFLYLIVH